MFCPNCKHQDTKVLESRVVEDGSAIRRRRKCLKCAHRFTTFERVEATNLLIVKKDGSRESFNRAKLASGIYRALEKRPIPADAREQIVARVESTIQAQGLAEISSAEVGETVMNQLKQVDDVAYVRFASVYRSFADLESFEEVLKSLKGNKR